MKCPFCKRELVRGEDRRYETLCDHVSNPNMPTHPLRPTFICGCLLSQGAYWDEQGEYYVTDYGKYLEQKKQYGDPLDHGSLNAIGSWSWRYVRERRRTEWIEKHIPFVKAYKSWRWRRVAKKFHPEWFTKEA